ncbi:MAG: mycothiol system anti-sigma-R factor [Acidimicrobiales bacterium]
MAAEEIDCSKVFKELYLFLDGELTPAKRSEIQGHLDDCLHCLEAFEFEAELKMMISHKCREQPPAALRERIFNALAEPPTRPPLPPQLGGGIPRL